jgi:hypothetical protein
MNGSEIISAEYVGIAQDSGCVLDPQRKFCQLSTGRAPVMLTIGIRTCSMPCLGTREGTQHSGVKRYPWIIYIAFQSYTIWAWGWRAARGDGIEVCAPFPVMM